jgi:DNA-binding transcriptional regulator PaaX
MNEVEIKLTGLNARQKVLADIMWAIEEWDDVERFIATLPKRERIECEGIVEMMKMELVETYRKGMAEDGMLPDNLEAKRVIDKFRLTK